MVPDFHECVTREEFVAQLLAAVEPAKLEVERIPLEQTAGRILAEDIVSRNTMPVCRQAPMDSVGLKSAMFADGKPDASNWVLGQDYVRADMGDDFPDEFDCVVGIEGVELLDNGGLKFVGEPHLVGKEGIPQRGSILQEGEVVVKAGARLSALQLGAIASAGVRIVPVYRKLRAAYIPTGNELVTAGQKLHRGETPESNSFVIAELLREQGVEPIIFPIILDAKDALADALKEAREIADLVLINGGSSKGSEDFNSKLLEEGASYYRHGANIAPGRVLAASVIDGKPVVNLPGPTIGAFTAMDWCVRYLIPHLQGIPMKPRAKLCARVVEAPKPMPRRVGPDGVARGPREMMNLVTVEPEANGDGYTVAFHPRNARRVVSMSVNAVYIALTDAEPIKEGDVIEVELM